MDLKKAACLLRKHNEGVEKKRNFRGSEGIYDRLQKSQEEEYKMARSLFEKWKGVAKSRCAIPRFYDPLPAESSLIRLKLREESRAMYLQRKNQELLGNEELQRLWSLLQSESVSQSEGDLVINYAAFMRVAEQTGDKCRAFFSPEIFSKLLLDSGGNVSSIQFFNYIMRKVWLHQTRIGLSLYDIAGLGYLKESDMDNYLLDLIPTLPQLETLEKSFYSFYVCTAARKFFFFLDPMGLGKVRIQDVLGCSFLDHLLELRDEDLPVEAQERNWFSAHSALRVYGQYLNLDKDQNGMLSKQELSRYGTGTLSSAFLDRVFQVCQTYEGELDYKTYLDFVLAMENRREPQALRYLFRLLDFQELGYLDVFTLNYFFMNLEESFRQHGASLCSFQDLNDEIFDMVNPVDPTKITLQDLVECGHGSTVISILIDLNDLWTYENREVLLAESPGEDDKDLLDLQQRSEDEEDSQKESTSI